MGVQATPRSMFSKSVARREAVPDAAEAEAADSTRQAPAAAAAGRERLNLRRSLGGAALRMSVAAFRVSGSAHTEGHGTCLSCGASATLRSRPPACVLLASKDGQQFQRVFNLSALPAHLHPRFHLHCSVSLARAARKLPVSKLQRLSAPVGRSALHEVPRRHCSFPRRPRWSRLSSLKKRWHIARAH